MINNHTIHRFHLSIVSILFLLLLGCGPKWDSLVDNIKPAGKSQEISPNSVMNFSVDPQSIPQITRSGLGCGHNECIWADTTDDGPGYCIVNLYTAEESIQQRLATLSNVMCAKNLVTFGIPPEIQAKYRNIYINIQHPETKATSEQTLIEINPSLKKVAIYPPTPSIVQITRLGLGCDKNQCVWLDTTDSNPTYCTVKIYSAFGKPPTLLSSLPNVMCSPHLVTFEIPLEIRTQFRSVAISLENPTSGISSELKTIVVNSSLPENTELPPEFANSPVLTCAQNECIRSPFSGNLCPNGVLIQTPSWIRPFKSMETTVSFCQKPSSSQLQATAQFEIPQFFRENYRTLEFQFLDKNGKSISSLQQIEIRPRLFPLNRLGIGYNIPSLIGTFTGQNSLPLLERNVRIIMAKRAIADAYLKGAQHIVVMAPGFFPFFGTNIANGQNDLLLWIEGETQNNPTKKEAYWKSMDDLVNEISKYGLGVIIRGWSDGVIFPNFANHYYSKSESIHDFISNSNSVSFGLYMKYWKELINRYKHVPELIAVGLPNELNLSVDLDLKGRCMIDYPTPEEICRPFDRFSTEELNQFSSKVVSQFKSLAPHLEVIGGMGNIRGSAYHMKFKPEVEVNKNGPDWTSDNELEFTSILRDLAHPFQTVDLHLYNGNGGGWNPGWLELNRFDPYCMGIEELYRSSPNQHKAKYDECRFSTHYIDLLYEKLTNSSININKALYFGELGEGQSDGYDFPFTRNVISKITAENKIDASVWALEFFQFNTYTYQDGSIGLDLGNPNSHPLFNLMIQKREELKDDHRFQNGGYKLARGVRANFSYPYAESYLDGSKSIINVLGSSETGLIRKVEIWIDDQLHRTLTQFPFKTEEISFSPGTHNLKAKVYDEQGNVGFDSIRIHTPGSSEVLVYNAGVGGCSTNQDHIEWCGVWMNTLNTTSSSIIRIYSDQERSQLLESIPIGGFQPGTNQLNTLTFGVTRSRLMHGFYLEVVNEANTPQEKRSPPVPISW